MDVWARRMAGHVHRSGCRGLHLDGVLVVVISIAGEIQTHVIGRTRAHPNGDSGECGREDSLDKAHGLSRSVGVLSHGAAYWAGMVVLRFLVTRIFQHAVRSRLERVRPATGNRR